ncbi:related to cel1 protein precursor [Serendipita indica DSM 11827]|uniref:AA9 family lytic polysaccharide monooxygenase n=1 Tax=Serendipita indica (strain DSM 11827) TaxID=1109443 RepID=G4TT03_SERID|nr:related to cel1 protein precursor [Serendipita indica DSM 11827]
MFKFASLVALAGLATRVAAHGAVTSYVIDGTTYPGYTGFSPSTTPVIQWQWPDYNPTFDPADSKWTHMEGSISVYLYKCSGAFSSCTGSGNGWFKIDEAGLLSGTMYSGTWGAGQVLKALQWSTKIPASLAPGNYLVRHELIAVHQSNAPQFYAECAQIVVTGSGTASPSGSYLVSIPGYCKLSDSNVKFDIYSEAAKTITSWDVPGPPVWPNGTPASTTQGGSTSQGGSSTASSTRSSSTSSTRTSTSNGASQTLYGQCGGQGWTGPTTCSSGTCKVSNQFYSQCLP